jgi:apolipoprotein N-acyltransferase
MPNPQANSWLRVTIGLALSLASAALLSLAFPPYNLGLLIWVGFIPMLLAQYRVLPRRISSLAPALAVGGWLGALLIPVFGGRSALMVAIPLLIAALSLVLDRNKRPFHERTGYRWFILEGVVGWVGLEMIRSFIPIMGTWAFVGYPLWNQPWLLQPLSVFGIYGLDLLILLCNYALAQAAFNLFDRHWRWDDAPEVDWRSAARWLGLLGILLAGWIGLSLALYIGEGHSTAVVRVAAIQPDLSRAAHLDTITPAEQRLAILAAQTREAAAQGAQVMVWPEMALGFDPQVQFTQELQALAAETRAYLVIGYVLDNPQGFRNEATVLAPSGEFLGVYGKTHPMLTSGEPKTISAGIYPVYETPAGRLATMICFDADFTDVARAFGRRGAQLIANPSLFGRTLAEFPYTQVVFRAIENRTAIVMADVAFNSVIVDSHGRVLRLAITPEGSQATLVVDAPLGSGTTLYSRFGDWLGWISLAVLILFAVVIPVTLRQARQGIGLGITVFGKTS